MKSKSKSLIGIAVASTFAWAATAQAGFDHSSSSAGTEQYASGTVSGHTGTAFGTTACPDEAIGSTASGMGFVGESFSGGYGEWTSDESSERIALSDEAMDAFSQQLFTSDPYLVAWTPIPSSDWDVAPDASPLVFADASAFTDGGYGSTMSDAGGIFAGSSMGCNEALGSTSSSISESVGGAFSSDSQMTGDSGFTDSDMASVTLDEAIDLASDGIYSDYYLVSWTPVTASDWDVYIVEPEMDYLVFTDDGHYLLSSYDVVLFPSDFFGSPELMSESGFASEDELNV